VKPFKLARLVQHGAHVRRLAILRHVEKGLNAVFFDPHAAGDWFSYGWHKQFLYPLEGVSLFWALTSAMRSCTSFMMHSPVH
jgi:hypothetical protein